MIAAHLRGRVVRLPSAAADPRIPLGAGEPVVVLFAGEDVRERAEIELDLLHQEKEVAAASSHIRESL